jgi:hypothetical protein
MVPRSNRNAQIARRPIYDITASAALTVTCTISGGTPIRTGTMLQPRPPETMTSQAVRA